MSQEGSIQSKRVFDYFRGTEGQQRYEELLHYAEWRVRRTTWSYGGNGTALPNGQHGIDVFQEVVQDTTTFDDAGNCLRHIPAHIELAAALRKIIRSKISHTFELSESRVREDRVSLSKDGEEIDALETDKSFWNPDGDRMPAEVRANAREKCDRFIEFARCDRVVYGMLVLLRDENLDKPAEKVAQRLGVNVAEIYVARKRLATLVGKFEEAVEEKR